MAGIALKQAEDQLALYLAAEAAVLQSQHYEINGRKLTRADLKSIQEGIKTWSERVTTLSNRAAGRSRRRVMLVGG